MDNKPYTTVGFTNGFCHAEQGENVSVANTGRVADLHGVDTTHPDFHQEALVPLENETYAAEDVAIFAGGPNAHLLHGVQE